MQKYLEFFKRQKISIKLLLIFVFLVIIAIAYGTLAYCSGSLLKTLRRGQESVFYYAFKDKSGKPILFVSSILKSF